MIDLGAVASNPDARAVTTGEEIARLDPLITALQARGAAVSIDAFRADTQRHAMARGVDYLNDIHGFGDPALYADLARSECRLILMHSVHGTAPVTRTDAGPPHASPVAPSHAPPGGPGGVFARLEAFFGARLAAFDHAGIARERVILDPGMGYFLGPDPAASFTALRDIGRLKTRFGLPVLISVSRKSFLRRVTGRPEPARAGAATLAAELFAAAQGADYIRTHDPAALSDGLKVWNAAVGGTVAGGTAAGGTAAGGTAAGGTAAGGTAAGGTAAGPA